jgi:SET domain-containing protein
MKSKKARRDWLDHVYHSGGYVNEILDDGKLFNHSDFNNTGINSGADPLSSYALRDIKKGEELFDDYGTYEHPKWLIKLCAIYGSAYDYFTIKSP